MKHAMPKRCDPYAMRDKAVQFGWNTPETIPLNGEGDFHVMTVSGLVRMARNGKPRRADACGPDRATVNAVKTGSYLGAIAWRGS